MHDVAGLSGHDGVFVVEEMIVVPTIGRSPEAAQVATSRLASPGSRLIRIGGGLCNLSAMRNTYCHRALEGGYAGTFLASRIVHL